MLWMGILLKNKWFTVKTILGTLLQLYCHFNKCLSIETTDSFKYVCTQWWLLWRQTINIIFSNISSLSALQSSGFVAHRQHHWGDWFRHPYDFSDDVLHTNYWMRSKFLDFNWFDCVTNNSLLYSFDTNNCYYIELQLIYIKRLKLNYFQINYSLEFINFNFYSFIVPFDRQIVL